MIGALALMVQAAVPPTPAPSLPQDWSTLPTLRVERAVADNPALSAFVRGEVRSGRCAAQRPSDAGWTITVDVAMLMTPQGSVRRTVPRAIGCPSVEQYAAGLAFSRAMRTATPTGVTSDGWYRTSMAFSWAD